MFTCYKNYWKNYFNFGGLSKRKDVWTVLIFNFIILSILGNISNVLFSLFTIATFIPSISLWIRRLHDGGHTIMPLIVVGTLDVVCSLLIVVNYVFSWIPVVGWVSTFLLVGLPGFVASIASLYLLILVYLSKSRYN